MQRVPSTWPRWNCSGFADSGLTGDAGPDTLAGAPVRAVEAAVRAALERHSPDVVVTLDGSDGHRDHVRVRDVVTGLLAGTGTPVYLQCLPRSLMHAWVRHHAADEGKSATSSSPEIGTPDEELTTIVDTSALLEPTAGGDRAAPVAAVAVRRPPRRCPANVARPRAPGPREPAGDGGPQETELLGLTGPDPEQVDLRLCFSGTPRASGSAHPRIGGPCRLNTDSSASPERGKWHGSADESMVAVWDSAPVAPELPDHLPDRARVVVIGGGVIGCSIAYHLAHLGLGRRRGAARARPADQRYDVARGGADDVLRVVLGDITSIRLYSRELYARLEAETGQATGFKPVGLIEAAADADRLEEYRRVAAFQRHLGLEVDEISPAEMNDLFPWAKTDDLLAGFHVPGDGRVNPVDLTDRARQGRAAARRTRPRGRHASPTSLTETRGAGRERHRRPRAATQVDRVRVRRQRHRHVGPRARAEVRPQRAQHRRRALLPDHRHHRRASARTRRSSRTPPPTATTARRAAG